ncbi:keratin-associated protein 24-1 [Ctenodactylus gundi]
MSFLGYHEHGTATPCRTHCYLPVATSFAVCSPDVSATVGHYLPSSYQGNLWLLNNCQGTFCESLQHEPKTYATCCESCNSPLLRDSPSTGQVVNIRETAKPRHSACGSRRARTKGYVSNCCTPTRCASKACQTVSNGPGSFGQLNYLPKRPQPITHCRLGSFGPRGSPNLGFISTGFYPSCYMARSYQPPNYFLKNCRYTSYRPLSCRPRSYLSRNFPSLSFVPSTFPPLRYLCRGSRSLNCY